MATPRTRWWFWLHSWFGLKLSLLLGFVLLTGTLAVLGHELDWLLNPSMRAPQVPEGEIAWGAAFDSARRERPDAVWLGLERPAGPGFALEATYLTSWREPRRLWFHPADGAFQGEGGWINVQRILRMVHRHLMLPPRIGIPIVSALSIALVVSLVSGFIVYKRFWRGLFRRPRLGRGGRLLAGDLHRLLALWSAWFVALIAITSLWYLVESLGGNAPAFPVAEPSQTRADALPADFGGRQLDRAVDSARRTLPGLVVLSIGFPREPDEPLVVSGQLTASLVRVRANRVSIDPVSGEVLGRYRGEDLGVHQRISEAADPLHFGTFGGLFSKFLWFVLGAALSALAFTGVAVYVGRIRRELRRGDGRTSTEGPDPHDAAPLPEPGPTS